MRRGCSTSAARLFSITRHIHVLNIENFKGNPKFEILYPLIRALHIDAQTVFYPEQGNQTPLKSQLQLLIGQCSEEEARVLIPVIESLLSALRGSTNESL